MKRHRFSFLLFACLIFFLTGCCPMPDRVQSVEIRNRLPYAVRVTSQHFAPVTIPADDIRVLQSEGLVSSSNFRHWQFKNERNESITRFDKEALRNIENDRSANPPDNPDSLWYGDGKTKAWISRNDTHYTVALSTNADTLRNPDAPIVSVSSSLDLLLRAFPFALIGAFCLSAVAHWTRRFSVLSFAQVRFTIAALLVMAFGTDLWRRVSIAPIWQVLMCVLLTGLASFFVKTKPTQVEN